MQQRTDALEFLQVAPSKNHSDLTEFIHQKMIKVSEKCNTVTDCLNFIALYIFNTQILII